MHVPVGGSAKTIRPNPRNAKGVSKGKGRGKRKKKRTSSPGVVYLGKGEKNRTPKKKTQKTKNG